MAKTQKTMANCSAHDGNAWVWGCLLFIHLERDATLATDSPEPRNQVRTRYMNVSPDSAYGQSTASVLAAFQPRWFLGAPSASGAFRFSPCPFVADESYGRVRHSHCTAPPPALPCHSRPLVLKSLAFPSLVTDFSSSSIAFYTIPLFYPTKET